jgi:uncharacterized membrane protein required for colicin V production
VLDFLLGIFLAGMAARGWLRGLVREVLDLAALVVGVAVSFRLSEPAANFLIDRYGVSPEWGRLGVGIGLFMLIGLAASILARMLGGVMKLPGLDLVNRIGGSLFALAWGSVLLILLISVARALPVPRVDDALDRSMVAGALTHPDAPTQQMFHTIAGDRVLESLLALEPLAGDRRIILKGDDRVEFPPVRPEEITEASANATVLFEFVNQARLAEGLPPLAWSDELAAVGAAYAEEMYLRGYLSHLSSETGRAADRVAAAGIHLIVVGENIGLASSARAVHAGLMDSQAHRANILHPDFDRVGIGAVQGPLGLMVVEVFGG